MVRALRQCAVVLHADRERHTRAIFHFQRDGVFTRAKLARKIRQRKCALSIWCECERNVERLSIHHERDLARSLWPRVSSVVSNDRTEGENRRLSRTEAPAFVH